MDRVPGNLAGDGTLRGVMWRAIALPGPTLVAIDTMGEPRPTIIHALRLIFMLDLIPSDGGLLTYIGIVVFLVLTGCGLPIPEEVPIVGAAVLSAKGLLNPWIAFVCCLAGALLGDCVMYLIGYHWGHGLLKDHPRFARFLHAEREAKFEKMLNQHGLKVLFVARFMVGVRSPVYLSAGILRISFRRFLLLDLFAATLVVGLFFGLTYAFGEAIVSWIRGAEWWLTVSVLAVVAIVVVVLMIRGRKRLARYAALQALRTERAAARRKRRLHQNSSAV